MEPRVFTDERGFFFESYSERTFRELGLPTRFVQDNHSSSSRSVLRGIHYQLEKPQGKLIRVLRGEIYDVAVDLRLGSASFGQYIAVVLSEANRRMLWIPPGFGHGFLALSDTAELAYKASELYDPASERTLLWNDPDVGIDWPLEQVPEAGPLLSPKDARGSLLRDAEVYEEALVSATYF